MKTPQEIVVDLRRRLNRSWHAQRAGDDEAFPHAFPLGRPTARELRSDYTSIHTRIVEWQDWARAHDVELSYENRLAMGGTTQTVPTHVHINSIEQGCAVAGDGWPERWDRAGRRLGIIRARFTGVEDLGRVIRSVEGYSQVDFEILLAVADWYLDDPARSQLGVTPRQVPIPGVHAKWLQNHRAGVQALTRLEDLGILPAHPARIHFTYLDPSHRAAGRRVHDSATVGDTFMPEYPPQVVVISENKDTAIHFPVLEGGIAVEGVGRGGKTVAAFPWIREAPVVVYWGDIDRDGFEILDGYRGDLERDIDSILMDRSTYDTYERFGTDLDQHGRPLRAGGPRPVDRLRPSERQVYLSLVDEGHAGHRRIEQERIPLDRALAVVKAVQDSVRS